MSHKLVPASEYTVQQLVEIYNRTRVDYIVPMPMNAARLQEYIDVYDIDLNKSAVALDADTGEHLGLGMLGYRTTPPMRSWITRLGVIPNTRKRGTGYALMKYMLDASEQAGVEVTILEVIHGNIPAYNLFHKCGFQETRHLLIVRRAPRIPLHNPTSRVRWLDCNEAVSLLPTRHAIAAWTNETESMANLDRLMGLHITLPNGHSGWITFERKRFTLGRLMYHTESGHPRRVARELLAHLHLEFPQMDTYTENIPTYDPHLPAFIEMDYFEAFRRIEMYRYPQGWLAKA